MTGDKEPERKFQTYPIGSFHIDFAEVRTAEGKPYLYVAIARSSKFVSSSWSPKRAGHQPKSGLARKKRSKIPLPNRRFLLDRANVELEKVQRFRTEASLHMIDVDAFKAVNDAHGHRAGDEVLRSISQVCAERLRHNDVLARFGGEEFVILLPDTNALDACGVADVCGNRA